MSVIVEVALGNPEYVEARAMELVGEAKRALNAPHKNPEEAHKGRADYHRLMTNAISLLVLARALRP
jgi:hypothetical protein